MLASRFVQFGPWIPLDALLGKTPSPNPSDYRLPRGAGIFQLRIAQGLVAYPHGKSAMVAYGGGQDVGQALQTLLAEPTGERALQRSPLLVRFAEPDPHSTAEAHLLRLRERFTAQFGSPPIAEVTESESR
jgi:hypothetical protein